MNGRDQSFEGFCEKLEELRGSVPLYRPTPEWEQRVFNAIDKIPVQPPLKRFPPFEAL